MPHTNCLFCFVRCLVSPTHSRPRRLINPVFKFSRCRCLSVSLCIIQLFTRSPSHTQPLVERQQRLRVKWLPLITAELMTDISTELLSNWIQWHWKACFFFSFSAEQHVTSNLFAIVMQTLFTWFLINSHLHYKKSDEYQSFCNWGVYSRFKVLNNKTKWNEN